MKKLLLLVAAATVALGATAASPKLASQAKSHDAIKELKAQGVIGANLKDFVKLDATAGALRAKAEVTPEGEIQPYVFSDYYYSAVAVSASTSEDGSKIYFSNMWPYVFNDGDAWVQGNISTDGTSVTIPTDVPIATLVSEDVPYNVYPMEMLLDESGRTIIGIAELTFVKDGDNVYIDDDYEAPQHLIGLCALDENGEFLGYFDYTYAISYKPYDGPTEVVELPEGAEPEEYIYKSYAASMFGIYEEILTGQVYIDGNDVYMDHLACGYEGWVKGTLTGNKVSFPAQYVGLGSYLTFAGFYTDGTEDEEGYLYLYPCDYELIYDAENEIFTAVTDDTKDYYVGLFDPDGGLQTYSLEFVIGKPVNAPTIPSDPYDLELSYSSSYGQYVLDYVIDPYDVNGRFLNTEYLAYYIYLDDEIYTLTPDVFPFLEEEIELVPYTFTEGWDIYQGEIWVAEDLLTTLGIQAVYTVDGIANYSNVVSIDLQGNVTVTPAPQGGVGLNNVDVKKVSSVEFYDAQGRKLDAAQKGVNVVKMVAADGSVKTVKMLKK